MKGISSLTAQLKHIVPDSAMQHYICALQRASLTDASHPSSREDVEEWLLDNKALSSQSGLVFLLPYPSTSYTFYHARSRMEDPLPIESCMS